MDVGKARTAFTQDKQDGNSIDRSRYCINVVAGVCKEREEGGFKKEEGKVAAA